jgi:flagellar biosynthesis anti-sigma factor FlgM
MELSPRKGLKFPLHLPIETGRKRNRAEKEIRFRLKFSNRLPILELQPTIRVEEIAMRINLNPGSPEALDGAKLASTSDARSTASPPSGDDLASSDTAELSLDHARIGALAAQVNNLPEIRQEKVAALATAIRNGTYDVSPEQTADAMVTDMLGNAA